MRCIICESNDWENVDHLRVKPQGMCICKKCGFVSYPEKYQDLEKVKEYYRKDYRNAPSVSNLFSGQKKIQYHVAFLKPLFETWKKEDKKPVVCDIGAATGMFLKMIKDFFPEADINGTEWGENFRKHAFYEYNIYLGIDFDESKKYDLISSYKVLEHQFDADLELKKYHRSLKDDGYLYLSIPTWFHTMNNNSLATWEHDDKPGIEYYYHPDHVNVFSRKHVEHLIRKCGFTVVEKNYTIYDDTYLLQKSKVELIDNTEDFEGPDAIKAIMEKIKKASDFYTDGKYLEAYTEFPNFYKAYTMFYEMNRKQFHEQGIDEIKKFLNMAIANCQNVADVYIFASDILNRYELHEECIRTLEKSLELKPGTPLALRNLSHCFRQLAHKEQDQDRKFQYLQQARNIMRHLAMISTENFAECMSWICQDHAAMPSPEIILQSQKNKKQ